MRAIGGGLKAMAVVDIPIPEICFLVIWLVGIDLWLARMSRVDVSILLSVRVMLLGVAMSICIVTPVSHGAS